MYFFAGVYALMFLFVHCDSDSTDLVWSVRHLRSRRLIRAAFSVSLCMASLSALAVSVTYSGFGDTTRLNPLLPVVVSAGTFIAVFVLIRGWVSAPWRVLGCAITARPNLFHRRRHQAEAIDVVGGRGWRHFSSTGAYTLTLVAVEDLDPLDGEDRWPAPPKVACFRVASPWCTRSAIARATSVTLELCCAIQVACES